MSRSNRRKASLLALALLAQACGPGAEPVQTTTTPVLESAVAPSPTTTALGSSDSPWIVYQAAFTDGIPNLGLIHPDGTGHHRIPGGPGNRKHPNWSPDGTRIVYDWDLPNGVSQIALLALDGTEEEHTLLSCVESCLGNGGPVWSPDGTTIGFDGGDSSAAEHGYACYMALLDVASGEVTRFIEHPGCEFGDSYLQFSPDGRSVVFQRGGPDGQAIFTATIHGQNQHQLTDWDAWARPDWSPDGDWIVFQDREPESHRGEVISLYRVRSDGSGLEKLTSPGQGLFDLYPRYLPDGTAILFSRCTEASPRPCETRLIDIDGENDRALIPTFGDDVVHVVWQPSP